MMKLSRSFLILIFLALPAQAAVKPVMVPAEILDRVRDFYNFQNEFYEFKPTDIDVYIKAGAQEHKVTLGGENNVLDLAKWVPAGVAEISIGFQSPYEFSDKTQLFYVSRYKPMEGKKQQFGLACGKSLKIQTQLKELFTTRGIKLMTQGGHYLNIMGGDYLLTHLDGKHLKVSQVKIRDGRWVDRLCKMNL